MEYYKDLITKKSFEILKDLKRSHKFVLIGGWAVYLYTHSLKSKDIDIILDYDELEKIRKEYDLSKNDRLKKYEIIIDEIDIDLYLPFYSEIGILAEDIKNDYVNNVEGFIVPKKEVLLILKEKAYLERSESAKGQKDKIDIISILNTGFDFKFYKEILKKYNLQEYAEELENIVENIDEALELDLNKFKYSKFKKRVLSGLSA
jgi:hypothetical protein